MGSNLWAESSTEGLSSRLLGSPKRRLGVSQPGVASLSPVVFRPHSRQRLTWGSVWQASALVAATDVRPLSLSIVASYARGQGGSVRFGLARSSAARASRRSSVSRILWATRAIPLLLEKVRLPLACGPLGLELHFPPVEESDRSSSVRRATSELPLEPAFADTARLRPVYRA